MVIALCGTCVSVQALNSFNAEARQMFLRFVWGRNRLPADERDWGSAQFTLNSLNARYVVIAYVGMGVGCV